MNNLLIIDVVHIYLYILFDILFGRLKSKNMKCN